MASFSSGSETSVGESSGAVLIIVSCVLPVSIIFCCMGNRLGIINQFGGSEFRAAIALEPSRKQQSVKPSTLKLFLKHRLASDNIILEPLTNAGGAFFEVMSAPLFPFLLVILSYQYSQSHVLFFQLGTTDL